MKLEGFYNAIEKKSKLIQILSSIFSVLFMVYLLIFIKASTTLWVAYILYLVLNFTVNLLSNFFLFVEMKKLFESFDEYLENK